MADNHYAPPRAEVRDPPVPNSNRLARTSIVFAASSVAAVVLANVFLRDLPTYHPFNRVMTAGMVLLAISAALGVAAFARWRGHGTRSTPLLKWVFVQSALALLVLAALLVAYVFHPGLQ